MATRKPTTVARKSAPAKTAAPARKPATKAAAPARKQAAAKPAPARKAAAPVKAAPAKKPATKRTPAAATENLTPLEKARLARANGTAKKKPAAKKKLTWKAPGDFKAAFYEVQFKTEKDGLVGGKINVTRIQGTYDRAPERNRRNLETFDLPTLNGIAARLGAATFVSKVDNRLPANTQFRALFRVGVRSADNTLTVTLRTLWYGRKTPSGMVKPSEMARTDPAFRRVRRTTQFLPAIFATAEMPPKLTHQD